MHIWNKMFLAFLFVIVMVSCSVTNMTREEKRALELKTAQMVNDSIANRTFKIDITYVNPNRMPARNLEYGYYIHVFKDSIDAYIPLTHIFHSLE